jgi:hypothetical protein
MLHDNSGGERMRRLWARLTRWRRYHQQDRVLARHEAEVIADGDAQLAKARAAGDGQQVTEIAKVVEAAKRDATNARLRLATDYYLEQAAELLVPLPEDEIPIGSTRQIMLSPLRGRVWKEDHGRRILTAQGVALLRDRIAAERRRRRELITAYLAAATGIIGATTGLVAVLGHRDRPMVVHATIEGPPAAATITAATSTTTKSTTSSTSTTQVSRSP